MAVFLSLHPDDERSRTARQGCRLAKNEKIGRDLSDGIRRSADDQVEFRDRRKSLRRGFHGHVGSSFRASEAAKRLLPRSFTKDRSAAWLGVGRVHLADDGRHDREGVPQEGEVHARVGGLSTIGGAEIYRLRGFAIPVLLDYDEKFGVLELSYVSPPFLLDFAEATLDQPSAESPGE
ncbi:MAG: hypothetical protein WD066_10105 [Planctomycetaceae bacterium]